MSQDNSNSGAIDGYGGGAIAFDQRTVQAGFLAAALAFGGTAYTSLPI